MRIQNVSNQIQNSQLNKNNQQSFGMRIFPSNSFDLKKSFFDDVKNLVKSKPHSEFKILGEAVGFFRSFLEQIVGHTNNPQNHYVYEDLIKIDRIKIIPNKQGSSIEKFVLESKQFQPIEYDVSDKYKNIAKDIEKAVEEQKGDEDCINQLVRSCLL